MAEEQIVPPFQRNWQSVRTVLESLILIGVVWLASSSMDQAKATVELRTQLAGVNNTLMDLRAQLADIPTMSRSMAKIEVQLDEHERRISRIEAKEK